MRKYHFVGLGHAVVDRLYNVPQHTLAQYDLKPGDFTRITLDLPTLGHPTTLPGGSIGNISYSLGLLGQTRGQYIGITGDDTLGQQARQSLADVGIDFLPAALNMETFIINVLVTPDNQRTFVPHNRALPIPHTVLDHIPHAEWLLLEGYILFEQPDLFIAAAEKAKNSGTKIVVFLAAPSVAQMFAPLIGKILRDGVDLLICNETEMHQLMQGLHSPKEAEATGAVIHFTPRVITHGAGGATYMDPAHYLYQPIHAGPIEVVDTTGAGDAFAAGFLDGYFRGVDIVTNLKAGHDLAQKVVQQIGARLPLAKNG